MLAHQLHQGLLVRAHVLGLKINTFLRKVALSPGARRSTRLAVNHDSLAHSLFVSSWSIIFRAWTRTYFFAAVSEPERIRISAVMRAVLFSMAATEQYLSSESRTASSTALRETCPEIV